MMEVIDNLGRAIGEAERQAGLAEGDAQKKAWESTVAGLRMVHDSSLKVFEKNHVRRVAPQVGDPFDPVEHEAVAALPPSQGMPQEDGKIAFCSRDGYVLHDRILRAAQVGVIKTTE